MLAVRVAGGNAGAVVDAAAKSGFLAGYDLGRSFADRKDQLLIAVTEKHMRSDLDGFLAALAAG